jgi:hypothetical protein
MRIIVGIAALVVTLGTGEIAAHACKHGGKVLFRGTQAPLEGHSDHVPDASLVIYASGSWGFVQEMPDGQEPASQGGCLSKVHLAELKRALARAKFAKGDPEMCDAVPERSIEYASPKRKRKVRVTLPCGDTTDARTQALADCAYLAQRGGRVSSKDARATCRGN